MSETNFVQMSRERSPLIVNDFDHAMICQAVAAVEDYQAAMIKAANFVMNNLSDLLLQLGWQPKQCKFRQDALCCGFVSICENAQELVLEIAV